MQWAPLNSSHVENMLMYLNLEEFSTGSNPICTVWGRGNAKFGFALYEHTLTPSLVHMAQSATDIYLTRVDNYSQLSWSVHKCAYNGQMLSTC